MMASASFHIANLLEKMTSTDKDFRFMATNDLMSELQKDSIKLDDDSERKVVKMLLKLLEDKNGEVQNLAVKCLGPLINKVKEYQVETIVDTLCTNMVSDKEQLRDISSIGLKTVINELPPASSGLAAVICKRITGRLNTTIAKQEDMSVQLEALDILGDLLSRFGGLLIAFHTSIQEALIPQLASSRLAVRKRSILAIGHLVVSCNQTLFVKLIEYLINELDENKSISTTRTYIQCIAAISRQAGHRFGDYLEKLMPLVMKYCRVDDDELREFCIQAFESFVRRESDDEYSDDDDMSWKVRRASAKCLEAIVGTRHEMLADFYKTISPALIVRFKEREENVKTDIFNAYIALLKQTRPTYAGNIASDPNAMELEEGPNSLLQHQVASIVKALHKQLKEKSVKTRQGCFAVLTELVAVLPGALASHIPALFSGIQYSLGEKNSSSNMKIDTLAFLNCLLTTHNPQVFHPFIKFLIPPIINAVGDSFYKITSEALLVLQQIVKVIRPLGVPTSNDFDFTSYVHEIYHCTLIRLKAADIDQEVKERAISCMGQVLSHLGDRLHSELITCFPIFLDRLRNEITRLTTVKALIKIASSPLGIDLRPVLSEAIPILAGFLRKNQRALKLSTLTLLGVLVKTYSSAITAKMLYDVLVEIPPLINENDLHISQLTLNLLTYVCRGHPECLPDICKAILSEILVLARSPLLQGVALKAMLEFFQAVVLCEPKVLTFKDLVQMFINPIYNSTTPVSQHNTNQPVHKQAYHSIAKCVAALTEVCPHEAIPIVRHFQADIRNPQSDSVQLFALLMIGEIGKHTDLSGEPSLKSTILDSFSSHNEEVKSSASFALGNVSIGNLPEYLPFILEEIQTQQRRQYLLLHSLKEIISYQSRSSSTVQKLQPFVESIWNMLFNHCECVEEGTRNVVAECIGKLTLIDPSALLPKLKSHLETSSPLARSTVVTAMKFTISDQPQPIDVLLKNCIGDFLQTLQDPDINVRRVALVAFNSAAHNKPMLIRDLLDSILPRLYNETKVRKDLIREVEMGPFKHTVDDGLDIRKAAFECMYTLLDSCLDRLDVYEFLNHVEDGLKDHYDIKMLTYLMLVRLATLCPHATLQRLDRLVEPLRSTCTTKVKANSVKQEFEKQDELKRSAMRAVAALLAIPDADKSPHMTEFVAQLKLTPDLQTLFESIQKDATTALGPSDSSLMDLS
ncbi:Cullin-associated NEDD8-dissociated protein 1 [Chamberlinius hualienensis]